ncbi:MAG TPA: glycosyltransferase family 39 protein [Terriglobales bacterium]|nr:glycosyltransferase family 39 protein [Terriglobales bacterium]
MIRPARPRAGASRVLKGALFGVALLFPATYLVIAVARMGYPFEVEWVEGAVLESVQRVLHGLPLYARPSLAYVPLNYTPLYFYGSALFAKLLGESFLPLRLLSFLSSLGCFALIALLVRHETRDRGAALLSVCLFAATYRLSGAWLDVARADSLYLLLLLGAIAALRLDPSPRRAPLASGALFALAFLAKQSAVMIAAPVMLHTLLADRRRFPWLAASGVAITAGPALALDRASGGWFRFYVFEVARGHAIDHGLIPVFWTTDLMGHLAIAVLLVALYFTLPRAGRARGATGFYAFALAGLLASAWSLRLYRGGYDNVLIPACAGIAILFGLGWHEASAALTQSPAVPGRALRNLLGLACLCQFVLLTYDPRHQIPTTADRAAGEFILAALRRAPGDVLVPSHGYLATRAGKPRAFHVMPLMDVLKSGREPVASELSRALDDSLRARHWSCIIVDNRDLLRDAAEVYYEPRWELLRDESVFWSLTGTHTRPQAIEAPREMPPGERP